MWQTCYAISGVDDPFVRTSGGLVVVKRWKTQTLELMKVMSDPRRSRILHLAKEQPVTVKQLAEQLGEQPSRLYYHVKKLLEVDLLEVVETRQHGNLVEKYYQAINDDVIYRGDFHLQSEHTQLALAFVHRKIDPALRLYEKGLEKVREEKEKGNNELNRFRLPYHISINSSTDRMTGKEWRQSLQQMMKSVGKEKDDEAWPELPMELTKDEVEQEGTYQHVIISYRIEDAEALGLIPSDSDEKEVDNGASESEE